MGRRNPVQSPRREQPVVDKTGKWHSSAFDLLQSLSNGFNGRKDENGFLFIILMGRRVTVGIGSPAGIVNGSAGDVFLRTDGGALTVLYVKEGGTDAAETTANWAAK